MDKMHINHHISQQFNAELEQIRNRVLQMGGFVEEQLKSTIDAFVGFDAEKAEEVIVNDYNVNAMEVSIDEECTQILARRQPTASDLRLVMAVIKTIADLERIGDEIKRIARMVKHLDKIGSNQVRTTNIEALGKHVLEMLHKALDAFARMDPEAGLEIAKEDLKVDEEYESLTRQLITYMMEDPRSIPAVLDITWSARSLERIGDRACNIGEYVIYFVKGKDVRHTSIEKMAEAIDAGN